MLIRHGRSLPGCLALIVPEIVNIIGAGFRQAAIRIKQSRIGETFVVEHLEPGGACPVGILFQDPVL